MICSYIDIVGAFDSLCILYSVTCVNIVFIVLCVYVVGAC
jgi:hypothetical protein